ncbi:MAG TPA: autotransporter-associated beta strand repeat-containing protein [Verrucomicrobiota bacterium]|nr:autotransporter-associated beta strand repeat-containing protein [Verrucomicrobiota bacterium]HQL79337.1 autotransporter-associated beta strand repeat-containing protein [Verrucomicrobiota bacterium]
MKTTHANLMGGQLAQAFTAGAVRCGRGLLAATAFLLLAVLPAEADTLYWDMNGTASGCGNVGGTWSTGGGNWNSGIAGSSSMDVWEDGDLATISAGNDGTGTWTITISGTVKTPRITYGGSLDTGNYGGLVSIAGGVLHFQDVATGHITYSTGHSTVGERTISSQISSDVLDTGFSVGSSLGGDYVTVINNTANNWYGACDIRSGTVKLGAAGVIPDGSVVQTAGGGGILDMAGYCETVKSIVGSVTVNHNNCTLTINAPSGEVYSGVISGTGNLIKNGTGAWTMTGINTYSGYTDVNAGNLILTGSLASGDVDVVSGATLSGTGTVYGPADIQSGGTLSPGLSSAPVGTFTLGSVPTLSGTVAMDINKSGATLTSDKVELTTGTLTYGGTLKVTASGDTLALGDTFNLFDASAFAGSFTLDLPGLPTGLVWDTSTLLVDGTIVVACDGTLTANAGADQVVFRGGEGGAAALGGSPTASGGSGSGYIYSWSPTAGLSDPTAANPTAVPASTTIYTVTVTDANGCEAPSDSVTVTVRDPVKVCIGTSKEILLNGETGSGIQWQSSANNVDWSDLSGKTGKPLNTDPITGTTFFRAKVTSGTCAPAYSTPLLIKLTQGPLTWTGGDDNWDFSTPGLWLDGESFGVRFCDSYVTYLDDSASDATPAITLDAAVSPASVANNSTKDYTISGTGKISGSGGLTKLGSSTLTLNTVNDYSGATTVGGGRLLVNGAIGSGAVTVQTGATLGGHNGVIGGDLTVQSGGVLDPGAAAGTIGLLKSDGKNVTLNSGSTTKVQVNRNGGSSLMDQVTGIGTFTAGGTLEVANLGADLLPGDEFTLFSAGTYNPAGEFTISPEYPNDDTELAWDTKALKERGVLGVHRHPKANQVDHERAIGTSFKIYLSPKMYAATDADGDPVELQSYQTPAHNGGIVTTDSTRLFYQQVNNEHDYFDFSVTDGRGGKGSARFYVWVKDYVGKVTISDTAGGGKKISFYGIPGYCYIIERTPEANPTDWTTQATVKPNTAGLVEWDDPAPLTEKAFYRSRTLKVGETCPP